MIPRSRRERGVTLVEMMIVVAIIGFVAAVVINRYTHSLGEARVKTAVMALQQTAHALDSYRIEKGQYPTSGGWATVTPALFGGSGNPYMNATPSDGSGGSLSFWNGSNDVYEIKTATTYDASLLSGFQQNNGSGPVSGTSYYLCYGPELSGIVIATAC